MVAQFLALPESGEDSLTKQLLLLALSAILNVTLPRHLPQLRVMIMRLQCTALHCGHCLLLLCWFPVLVILWLRPQLRILLMLVSLQARFGLLLESSLRLAAQN